MPSNGDVSLKIYNTLGKEVAILVDNEQPAGKHEVSFNASDLSSGVYFYRIKTDNFVQTKKMIFVK